MDFERYIDCDYKCHECSQEDSIDYCKPCNSVHFSDNFAHWISGDSNFDELIQNSQLNADNSYKFIEWIEYSNRNIEFIAHAELMRHCWDPVPNNRPTAVEFENHKEKFTREQKNKWKAILVELATNPSKKSQNMLTSKRLLSLKIGT
ncbi:kinase-like domain-containing protein [Rhizophagus irregularis DAOM 181602=DAOM 197198]|nr:kinase-like domain-containing protein [Rhizophagus irregularis DAOM 181602=DAOM 197198]